MDSPVITCDIKDHIALVTMNNPPVNAQSPALREGVTETFDRISDLPEVRVAVLTAAGRVFSAGADIKSRAGQERQPGDQWAHSRGGREMFHSIVECRKPVIGALNGPIELEEGFSVFRVEQRTPPGPVPYAEAVSRAEWWVQKQLETALFDQLFTRLREKYADRVTLFEERLGALAEN